jgi:ankyrin repeat protein
VSPATADRVAAEGGAIVDATIVSADAVDAEAGARSASALAAAAAAMARVGDASFSRADDGDGARAALGLGSRRETCAVGDAAIDGRNAAGHTMLFCAAKSGRVEEVALLLGFAPRAASPNARCGALKEVALHVATRRNHVGVVRALLDAGADPGECSFVYRYTLRESCSQFDSLPLTSLMISPQRIPRGRVSHGS